MNKRIFTMAMVTLIIYSVAFSTDKVILVYGLPIIYMLGVSS